LIATGSAAAPKASSLPDAAVLPIVGRVAAGTPITATENLDGEFVLPAEFARKPGSFMLRVQGESMIDAAILDGDLIVVSPQPDATNGEIVVALVDGEATVKRFYREAGRIRLQPENRDDGTHLRRRRDGRRPRRRGDPQALGALGRRVRAPGVRASARE
jgi:SOS regulatory protein LexA